MMLDNGFGSTHEIAEGIRAENDETKRANRSRRRDERLAI